MDVFEQVRVAFCTKESSAVLWHDGILALSIFDNFKFCLDAMVVRSRHFAHVWYGITFCAELKMNDLPKFPLESGTLATSTPPHEA